MESWETAIRSRHVLFQSVFYCLAPCAEYTPTSLPWLRGHMWCGLCPLFHARLNLAVPPPSPLLKPHWLPLSSSSTQALSHCRASSRSFLTPPSLPRPLSLCLAAHTSAVEMSPPQSSLSWPLNVRMALPPPIVSPMSPVTLQVCLCAPGT